MVEKKSAAPETSTREASNEREEKVAAQLQVENIDEVDLTTLHEKVAGRLVVDPEEAKIEFGEKLAAKLKLSRDGTKVLWPQPTDDPEDPQNWSDRRKTIQLIIISMAAVVPDFDSAIGIAGLFPLANEYGTTTDEINNLTSNWSIFLLGWGGIAAVMVVRRYGRLPVLFWSQLLALGFLIGCAFAPNLNTFAAMRCLTAFFGTAPQVTGLYVISDVYPFHMQARMLNIWTMAFIASPFISPFLLGFVAARTTWRIAYGIGCIYGGIVVLAIVFFMEETMYDRNVKPIPPKPTTGLRYRVETLLGKTALHMAKYRTSWAESIASPFRVVWRPHMLLVFIYEGVLFGFGIGINVTNVVFLGEPEPLGYGFDGILISAMYATPLVAVFIGELIGRFANDYIADVCIRRNRGVFEAEMRLWACYIAIPFYVLGFVLLGASFQNHLSVGALVIGWAAAELSIMIHTVALYAYCNDAFPKHRGEISALINHARILGGFAVPYFQIIWAKGHGALQTYGCEAAIVAGLFVMIIPFMQLKGRRLRELYSLE